MRALALIFALAACNHSTLSTGDDLASHGDLASRDDLAGRDLAMAQGCVASGGGVSTTLCCAGSGDFPNTCGIGACSCAPASSHMIQTCECGAGKCFDGNNCVAGP